MTVEIKVGPPVITLSQGRTFMVTTQAGEIQPDSDQGVYAIDTRFISFYRLFINRALEGHQLQPVDLLCRTLSFNQSRHHYRGRSNLGKHPQLDHQSHGQ